MTLAVTFLLIMRLYMVLMIPSLLFFYFGCHPTSADDRKVDASRQTRVNGPRDHAEAAGPAASMGPSASGRPVPETIWEVNRVLEQSKQLRGKPDKSLAEIEKQSKLLLDEFLQNGNEQVNVLRDRYF